MPTQLQYTRFNDFRPGIITRSNYALRDHAVPAPLGAAQFTNTYRCIALPTGGLAPAPRRIATWGGPVPSGSYDHGPWTVGFQAFGPINGTQSAYADELLVGVDWIDGATHLRSWRLFKLNAWALPYVTNTIGVINTATAAPVDQYWGMSFATSRALSAAPYTTPGYPIVVFDWSEPGPGTIQRIFTFPDPAVPAANQLATLSTVAGQVIGHQGRIVQLTDLSYPHGSAPSGIPTNEQVRFTDPPNSMTLGTQDQVFSQEYPVGYGAWGSISAGELFLVKNAGGGVIVSGDIAFPTITRLPGVVSTGQWIGKSASTPQGLFYMSKGGGVYVWRGSDTSQPVSPQLDFNTAFANPAPMLNMLTHLEAWHDLVLASNNWLYDTDNGGWWQIENQSDVLLSWWSRGSHGNLMYGAPVAYSPSACAYTYDKHSPALSWSWQSHPLNVTDNRLPLVREIVLLAQGSGTVTITLTKLDGSTQTETFTVTQTSFPQKLRVRTAAKGYTVIVQIQSNGGSNPAPIVHAVDLGWEESQEATTV